MKSSPSRPQRRLAREDHLHAWRRIEAAERARDAHEHQHHAQHALESGRGGRVGDHCVAAAGLGAGSRQRGVRRGSYCGRLLLLQHLLLLLHALLLKHVGRAEDEEETLHDGQHGQVGPAEQAVEREQQARGGRRRPCLRDRTCVLVHGRDGQADERVAREHGDVRQRPAARERGRRHVLGGEQRERVEHHAPAVQQHVERVQTHVLALHHGRVPHRRRAGERDRHREQAERGRRQHEQAPARRVALVEENHRQTHALHCRAQPLRGGVVPREHNVRDDGHHQRRQALRHAQRGRIGEQKQLERKKIVHTVEQRQAHRAAQNNAVARVFCEARARAGQRQRHGALHRLGEHEREGR
mmetsp:Transcript_48963/g.119927  ORF Transcript_48963/g.119927 Transcript_48963/m.119927 type:complete len:356 (+) Transcript_48963:105-1172(+)